MMNHNNDIRNTLITLMREDYRRKNINYEKKFMDNYHYVFGRWKKLQEGEYSNGVKERNNWFYNHI